MKKLKRREETIENRMEFVIYFISLEQIAIDSDYDQTFFFHQAEKKCFKK